MRAGHLARTSEGHDTTTPIPHGRCGCRILRGGERGTRAGGAVRPLCSIQDSNQAQGPVFILHSF
jgi:hypothetical protein